MTVSPQIGEPQTPQAGVVPPADVKHRPRRRRRRRRQRRRWRQRCRNTTRKSSVLRFYLHKMIGLTTSRSKRRPRWFSLRILLFPDTRSPISFRSVAFRFRGNNTATTVIKSDANGRGARAKKFPTRIFLSRRAAQLSRIANLKDRKRNVIASKGKENSKVWKDAKYIPNAKKFPL